MTIYCMMYYYVEILPMVHSPVKFRQNMRSCRKYIYVKQGVTLCTNITGGQPLKLAHSLLGYAVDMTDINRPGWPITRKQAHRNNF